MELIDLERNNGNELCQAIVNLPPLDSLFSDVRAFLLSSGKQQLVIDKIAAVKADGLYKQLEESLKGDFEPVSMMPSVLVAAEAYTIAWRDLPKNLLELSGEDDLVEATKKSYDDLGLLLQPIVNKQISFWQVLDGHMSGLMVKIDDSVVAPSDYCLASCIAASGKLKIMAICLNRGFPILMEACSTTKLEIPQSCQTGWSHVQAISAAVELMNAVVDVQQCLVDGKLKPDGARLEQASSTMHALYQALREFQQHSGVPLAMISEVVEQVCPLLKLWAQSLSAEVLVPLRQKFFSEIFAHACLPDHNNINCYMFSL